MQYLCIWYTVNIYSYVVWYIFSVGTLVEKSHSLLMYTKKSQFWIRRPERHKKLAVGRIRKIKKQTFSCFSHFGLATCEKKKGKNKTSLYFPKYSQ